VTLLPHPDVLAVYGEGLQETDTELPPPQKETKKHSDTTPKTTHPEDMSSKIKLLDKQIPDPLKQLQQQQADAFKLKATQSNQ